LNGKVERSHKTDSEEFYQDRHFKHKRDYDLARSVGGLRGQRYKVGDLFRAADNSEVGKTTQDKG
jgi:hypothetical protein